MTNIKTHIDQAIRNIELDREQTLRQVEQRVMQEKILPYNREIDEARDRAIQQLTVEREESIKAVQEKYTKEKSDILTSSEQRKKEHAAEVVAKEAAALLAEYDMTITALKATLSKTEE